MINHDRYRDALGAYALGALPEDERSQLERHMATCHDCRLEADELTVVVAELPETTESVAPPAELRSRIMAVVEADAAERSASPARTAERGGWSALLRPRAAVLAACVLLLAGIGAGIAVTGDEGGSWQAEVVMADASAEVEMASDHATLAVYGMPPPPTGRVYQVWVQHGTDKPRPTKTLFKTDPTGEATVLVRGEMKGVDKVLVTEEPRGGSRAPTRSPVIVARPA